MSDIMEAVREAGYQEGLKVGKEIEFKIGVAERKREIALKMIADGDSNSRIKHLTDLTDEEINELRNGGEQII